MNKEQQLKVKSFTQGKSTLIAADTRNEVFVFQDEANTIFISSALGVIEVSATGLSALITLFPFVSVEVEKRDNDRATTRMPGARGSHQLVITQKK